MGHGDAAALSLLDTLELRKPSNTPNTRHTMPICRFYISLFSRILLELG